LSFGDQKKLLEQQEKEKLLQILKQVAEDPNFIAFYSRYQNLAAAALE